jgi:methylenetetrahydrofolate reductase (NADPH)
MKVIDHLNNAKSTLFSIEILPPLKGQSMQSIFDGIDPLMEFKPAFVDVTYHREEFIYKKNDQGILEKITVRKRPGTVGICAAIMNKYKVDAVPHIICGGFNKEETENALIDLQFLGIDNVLALQGDFIKNAEPGFVAEPGGHAYADDLVKQIVKMNKGKYLHEELKEQSPTDFCIGVAGYPEKHIDAADFDTDIMYLKAKVDAGAEYIVTQMFFDNSKFFKFRDTCLANGITVPIIPGLKILSTKNQVSILPKIFSIDLPEALASEIDKCTDNTHVKELGIEWSIQQSKELMAKGAPCLHYYTMGKSEITKRVASQVF